MNFSNLLALQVSFVNIIATLEPQVRESIASENQTHYYGQIRNFTNSAKIPRIGFRDFRTYNAIQVRLASLILQLKTYMSENNLTKHEREIQVQGLRKDIATVTNLAAEMDPLQQLDDQIRLIKHVYHVAADTDHLIEFFSLTDSEQHLVSSFVHLNLELLNLHNINGVPSAGTHDCRSRVATTIGSFMYWETVMDSLTGMPVSVRELLERRFTEAKYLLGVAEAAVLNYHRKK
ncbi:hypothetical protein OXX69_007259 [Metschnikowia pulcherrima]